MYDNVSWAKCTSFIALMIRYRKQHELCEQNCLLQHDLVCFNPLTFLNGISMVAQLLQNNMLYVKYLQISWDYKVFVIFTRAGLFVAAGCYALWIMQIIYIVDHVPCSLCTISHLSRFMVGSLISCHLLKHARRWFDCSKLPLGWRADVT